MTKKMAWIVTSGFGVAGILSALGTYSLALDSPVLVSVCLWIGAAALCVWIELLRCNASTLRLPPEARLRRMAIRNENLHRFVGHSARLATDKTNVLITLCVVTGCLLAAAMLGADPIALGLAHCFLVMTIGSLLVWRYSIGKAESLIAELAHHSTLIRLQSKSEKERYARLLSNHTGLPLHTLRVPAITNARSILMPDETVVVLMAKWRVLKNMWLMCRETHCEKYGKRVEWCYLTSTDEPWPVSGHVLSAGTPRQYRQLRLCYAALYASGWSLAPDHVKGEAFVLSVKTAWTKRTLPARPQ